MQANEAEKAKFTPVRDGRNIIRYKNGQVHYEENYKDGKLSGLTNVYYPNGQILIEKYYTNNKLDGELRMYGASGKLKLLEEYREGCGMAFSELLR